jgi:hypothetical protein
MKGDSPEHADLGLDMAPFARCLKVMGKVVVQLVTHADDSVSHALHFLLPTSHVSHIYVVDK